MWIMSPDPRLAYGFFLFHPRQVQPDVNHQELGSLFQLCWDLRAARLQRVMTG